jgi:hypothetical protein
MKKLLVFLSLTLALFTQGNSQAMWSAGNKVQLTYPTGVTGATNKYMFPSWQKVTVKSADTIPVSLAALETYIQIDTVKRHNNVMVLTVPASVLPGAKLVVATSTIDSTRNVYISQGTTRLDTIPCKSLNDKRLYIYDGVIFQKIPY